MRLQSIIGSTATTLYNNEGGRSKSAVFAKNPIPVSSHTSQLLYFPAKKVFFGNLNPSEKNGKVTFPITISRVAYQNLLNGLANAGLTQTSEGMGTFITDYLAPWLNKPLAGKTIMPSAIEVLKTRKDGMETKVQSLIGAQQIFEKWMEILDQTQEHAEIALYDFDNLKVEGGAEPAGAQSATAWYIQQKVLPKIEERARNGVKFKIVLDGSVQYEYEADREPITPRKRNNKPMIDYLRDLNETLKKELKTKEDLIEAIPYPRNLATIYHVKMLTSDNKRGIVSGMNLSNHSAANWDMGVAIEGPEVQNLMADTFYPDWTIAKYWDENFTKRGYNPDTIFEYLYKSPKDGGYSSQDRRKIDAIWKKLPAITPVSDPAFRILNTIPWEYNIFLKGTMAEEYRQGDFARQDIEDYFQEVVKNPNLKSLLGEQFIACHTTLGEQLIERFKSGVDIKIVHSNSVDSKFPYTRRAIQSLKKAGLARYYPEDKTIGERLHAKVNLLTYSDPKTQVENHELVLGSANMSVAAFQTNLETGKPRGNRDLAIAIPLKQESEIAETFRKQILHDWEISTSTKLPGYGLAETARIVNAKLARKKVENQEQKPAPTPQEILKNSLLNLKKVRFNGLFSQHTNPKSGIYYYG